MSASPEPHVVSRTGADPALKSAHPLTHKGSERAVLGQVSYHGEPAGSLASTITELWRYRELFYFLAWRDVKVRYKQTALGVVWAVLQPLLTMAIFTAIFGRLANIPSGGLPRPLFYFCALVPWTYLSSSVNSAAMSLVSNTALLTKIYFPRLILPASAALSGLLDFLISSLLLIPLMFYYHTPVDANLLLWPVLVALIVLLALGVGLFLAALNVQFRDVKYAIPFAIQIWLFVSPIIYPSSIVPAGFRWLVILNPLTGIVEAFRTTVTADAAFDWVQLAISGALTVGLFLGALVFFKRTERAFADIV